MSIELVSFATLKKALNLEQSSITDYPILEVVQPSVVSAIENYLGRYFESTTYTETIRTALRPTRMIALKALPIASITSASIDGTATTNYDITDWGLRLSENTSETTIAVSYIGGLSSVPDDLARAALIQTVYEFKLYPHVGASTVISDGGTIERPAIGLLKEVKRILAPFIHPIKRMGF